MVTVCNDHNNQTWLIMEIIFLHAHVHYKLINPNNRNIILNNNNNNGNSIHNINDVNKINGFDKNRIYNNHHNNNNINNDNVHNLNNVSNILSYLTNNKILNEISLVIFFYFYLF